jgi:phage tail-like protein
MSIEERFYALLPQLYRDRDQVQGQPLRALLAVLEGEYQALKTDMEATYDNWFVDTCDQWVLPYLADLLGQRGLSHDQRLFPTQRRLVANALGYRRRKGTAAVLEHVLRDVTGWDVRVVEYSQLLAVTQHLANFRPDAGHSVDLRDSLAVAQAGGAFERFAHTVDVRGDGAPASSWPKNGVEQPKYHPATLGIFIWRLSAYPLDDTFARPVSGSAPEGCFTFDAAGRSVPLFNRPQAVDGILDRAETTSIAIPLTRALLALDLDSYAAQDNGAVAPAQPRGAQDPNELPQAANTTYYGPDRSFFISYRTNEFPDFQAVRPAQIVMADLTGWKVAQDKPANTAAGSMEVAVDPELGRMRFLGSHVPKEVGDVIVNYTYGFSADLGGGSYSRYDTFQARENLPEHTLRISVAEGGQGEPLIGAPASAADSALDRMSFPQPVRTLQTALATWERYCALCAANQKRPVGVIVIRDNGRYGGRSRSAGTETTDPSGDLVIPVPTGAQLSILAADGKRPSIRPFNNIRITTALDQPDLSTLETRRPRGAAEPVALDRRLELNGLLLEGRPIEISDESIDGFLDLHLKHCTSLESGIHVKLNSPHGQALRLEIEHSIVGALRLPQDLFELVVKDSILDPGSEPYAITGAAAAEAGPATTLERVTILGSTHVCELKLASDVIFTGPLQVDRCATGLIRRSYVPLDSAAPSQREQCQPAMALQQLAQTAATPDGRVAAEVEAAQDRVRRHIRPLFRSTKPGHPAYTQLHPLTPPEIRGGGQAGAEMGAFHNLYQLQREANFYQALEEYLPLGKHVSVHFVT